MDRPPALNMEIFVPYRICPLGAHVDHQEGIVAGATLKGIGITLSFERNRNGKVCLSSEKYPGEETRFRIDDIPPPSGKWGDYARGSAYTLNKIPGRKPLRYGISGALRANFPGGGLSSSAAVTLAYLYALEFVNGINLSPLENIKLVRDVENVYIGLKSGILDQSVILLGRDTQGSLLFLDCRSMEHRTVLCRKPADYEIAIVFSGIDTRITGTLYNRRVSECREAAKLLAGYAGINQARPLLRDLDPDVFREHGYRLPSVLRKRAEHFFTEMERVNLGMSAWEKGDIEVFGRLVSESGKSSLENYECGSEELAHIYGLLNSVKGVYGARFSGAGFRGSCMALSRPGEDTRQAIRYEIEKHFADKYPSCAGKYRIGFCPTGGTLGLTGK